MAVLLEPDVKTLLREVGLDVPQSIVCHTPDEARRAAQELGPAVVKALVPTGRRGKAGAVRLVQTPEEAESAAGDLFGSTVYDFPVNAVLVEEKESIAQECYVSVTIDGQARTWQLLFTPHGGVEVEERLARGEVSRLFIDPRGLIHDYQARTLAKDAGLSGKILRRVGAAITRLVRLAVTVDASLLEINPLAITSDQRVVSVGAMLALDDGALPRHPELEEKAILGVDRVGRPLTPLEQRMIDINQINPQEAAIRFSEFRDGDLGFMILGGGAGLVSLDELMRCGGRPATFFDMTAGDATEKIYLATKAVLQMERIRGLMMGVNISAFAPVPIRVRGIVRALRESGRDFSRFPVVIRMAGPREEEAAQILQAVPHVHYIRDEMTLEEAVRLFVDLVEKQQ